MQVDHIRRRRTNGNRKLKNICIVYKSRKTDSLKQNLKKTKTITIQRWYKLNTNKSNKAWEQVMIFIKKGRYFPI